MLPSSRRAPRAAALLFGAVLASAGGARAYEESGDSSSHGATSIGPRATFFRPTNADHGRWEPGVQARLRASASTAVELSADFSRYYSNGTSVHTIPVQATLIGYFYPESAFSPYLLVGGGWYLTRADGPYSDPYRRFGPHAGAGAELLLGGNFSIDGSYRYLWTQVNDPRHPWGHAFSERGHMLTVGLNYRL